MRKRIINSLDKKDFYGLIYSSLLVGCAWFVVVRLLVMFVFL